MVAMGETRLTVRVNQEALDRIEAAGDRLEKAYAELRSAGVEFTNASLALRDALTVSKEE